MPLLVRLLLLEFVGFAVFFSGVFFGVIFEVFLGESLKWIVPFGVRSIRM